MCQTPTSAPKKRIHGMNFISQHKRLSLYLRDGLSCVYCGASVEDEVKLTADHVIPYSHVTSNQQRASRNAITGTGHLCSLRSSRGGQ